MLGRAQWPGRSARGDAREVGKRSGSSDHRSRITQHGRRDHHYAIRGTRVTGRGGRPARGRDGRGAGAGRGHRPPGPDARRRRRPRADRRHQEDRRDPRDHRGEGRLAHRRRGDGGRAQGAPAAQAGVAGRGRGGEPHRLDPGAGARHAGRQPVQRLAGGRQRARAHRGRGGRHPGRSQGPARPPGRGRHARAPQARARARARSSSPSCCRPGRRARATPTCASSRARRWTSPWWARA